MTKRNEAIAILTGGGPAPGMNTVVGSVAKTFLQKGYSVIGLHKGFTGLFREAPATENITFLKADEIFNLAGSFLRMSRFKPSATQKGQPNSIRMHKRGKTFQN